MSQPEISETVASTHLKSPLDLALEESVKRANKLHEQIEKAKADGEDITGKELAFNIKEKARLDTMASLQERLDVYRTKNNTAKTSEKKTEALNNNNSTILGNHLTAAGKFRPNSNWDAHHIICTKHASHAYARSILFSDKMKYGINDPDNGCWLPKKHKYAQSTHLKHAVGHAYIHTKRYAAWINSLVLLAKTKLELQGKLKLAELKLLNAKTALDKSVLTQKGRDDLQSTT